MRKKIMKRETNFEPYGSGHVMQPNFQVINSARGEAELSVLGEEQNKITNEGFLLEGGVYV